MNVLYNTDLQIWFNYFKSNPDHNMTFLDGHVIAPNGDVLARFENNDHAMKVLNVAREQAAPKSDTHAALIDIAKTGAGL